ncbi:MULTISPECIES: immunoglobulin-like domain-containing protein [Listeria]|uniref:immunoglobulin-like domain-containing protein n=1 Tax=Listeria TaxID=1637 RepID=UPI0013562B57|nr:MULTISPECIES: immunoglobulin-like domain-containing protein [Listeria]
MTKKKKLKKSMLAVSSTIFLTNLIMIPISSGVKAVSNLPTTNLQASPAVISLVNGDFENPHFTASYKLYNQSSVPGWQTTASDGKIELQRNIDNTKPQSGTQWAELNAYEASALYQDIPTTPGVTVHWQVYHKGRMGDDTAVVEFGAPGGTMTQQAEMTDGNTEWGLHKGTYTIPEGQTTTRFQFRAVSSAGGNKAIGNLLDNVQFATQSVLQVEGAFSEASTKVNKDVNYNIKATNVGGMAATSNTFSVKIPEELTYTPGSLSSSDTSITGESYDEATRTLTFTTGKVENNTSINITVPLKGATEVSSVTPDTTVVYHDENFEEDTYTADGTDQSVAVTSNDVPVIQGEQETIIQPNVEFDPMKTIQATDKEDGDLTSQVKVIDNPVNTGVSGTYEVTYEVTDSDGNKATFTRQVVVEGAPVFSGNNEVRLNPDDTFDPLADIQATDKEDGNVTDKIKVTSNHVEEGIPGTYEVTYEVADSAGNITTYTRTVIVTEAPQITGESTTRLNPTDEFDPMSTIQATDKEDGNLTNQVKVTSNSVEKGVPGTYKVSYEVTDSDGNKALFDRSVTVTEAPEITGEKVTRLNPNDEFDPMSTIQATDKEDGEMTDQIKVTSNTINKAASGTYEVSYEVTDSDGNKTTFTRTVIVTEAPVMTGEKEIRLNPTDTFDPMKDIQATDKEDGDVTEQIRVVNNEVQQGNPGTYEVTYEVSDSDGNKTTFDRTVIVTEAPEITGEKIIRLQEGDAFDPMSDIQATDKEDGDITSQMKVVSNEVDTSKPDAYEVTYEVTDSDGNTTNFQRIVIITELPVNHNDDTDSSKQDKNNTDTEDPAEVIKAGLGNTNPISIEQSQPKAYSSTPTVKEVTKDALPKTGDSEPAAAGLIGLGLLAIGSLFFWRKK